LAGGRDRDRTCDFCRVKAQSRDFAAQVNGCETAADLDVCCLLLSFVVPQVSPSYGPGAAPGAVSSSCLACSKVMIRWARFLVKVSDRAQVYTVPSRLPQPTR
jgi:hypothetical protein